ncbi:MAG TPA: hypothetical protein PLA48_02270, partial [Holophaga sp.]|nr:hypothetical protein [Holophaga sp.]
MTALLAREKTIILHFFIMTLMLISFASSFTGLAFAESANNNKADQIKVFELKIRSIHSRVPIIDVEHHWGGKFSLQELARKMDKNGVALTWLGPNEKLGDEYSLRANQSCPDYFVPTIIHGDGPLWHGKNMDLLDKIASDVRSSRYFAMGEFEARHYPSSTNDRDVHMPLTSESFKRIFSLSQETGLPFLVHHEAEDSMLPEMEAMLKDYPNAKVIWCHVGRNRNPV